MSVHVTLHVEGVCDSLDDLEAAVAYLSAQPTVVEFSYSTDDLLVSGTTATFAWSPEPPAQTE